MLALNTPKSSKEPHDLNGKLTLHGSVPQMAGGTVLEEDHLVSLQMLRHSSVSDYIN